MDFLVVPGKWTTVTYARWFNTLSAATFARSELVLELYFKDSQAAMSWTVGKLVVENIHPRTSIESSGGFTKYKRLTKFGTNPFLIYLRSFRILYQICSFIFL